MSRLDISRVENLVIAIAARAGADVDMDWLSRHVRAVLDRKNPPATEREAAAIVAERIITRHRRLSHGTGATGWADVR